VWTDVFQLLLIVGAVFGIIIAGIVHCVGISGIVEAVKVGGRMNMFSALFDFEQTHTPLSTVVAFATMALGTMSTSPMYIQRYLSTGSKRDAQKALLLNVPVLMLIHFLIICTGLVAFAVLGSC